MRLDRAIDAYLRHITIERGLSEHTVGAYRRDLAVYLEWLTDAGIDDTSAVTGAIIGRFIADRSSAGAAASSSRPKHTLVPACTGPVPPSDR